MRTPLLNWLDTVQPVGLGRKTGHGVPESILTDNFLVLDPLYSHAQLFFFV